MLALLEGLVDDAGLFPPERLPMSAALERHRADEAGGHPVLTHRFLCPASAIGDLRDQLRPAERLRLGLIADTGPEGLPAALDAVADDPRLVLETVEVALPPDRLDREAVAALAGRQLSPAQTDAKAWGAAQMFVELPRAPGWREALDGVASAGLGAKVRCGGLRAELFPSPAELADFVLACAGLGVPFKATAGLHHAVRHRDPATGFDHHGFLNLLLAATRAASGASAAEVSAALELRDSAALAAEARATGEPAAAAGRRLLIAYGSCSTSEPLEDLAALGLLGAPGNADGHGSRGED